ncbi:MAG: general stress protein [Pseudomonadota bacterium]|nr:general stress protein [Pseudomonadota bacterium]
MQKNVNRSNRGFASMNTEKQREIARKGGRSVPDEKRSFSQNRQLASEAGRKGGHSSHGNQHSGQDKNHPLIPSNLK